MNGNRERHDFHLEIVGAFLALCAGFLGIAADYFHISTEVYLPVVTGFLITAAASLLKAELVEHIHRSFKIQRLLNQIEDADLHKRGVEIVRECEYTLENLSQGIIRLRTQELYKILIDKIDSAQHHIYATHLALDLSYMYNWEVNQGVLNYYRANLRAVKRGVAIERLFILRKEDVLDRSSGQIINTRIVKVLQDQQKDGIEVFITWFETVSDAETIEDFAIIDDKEIEINYPMVEGRYYNVSLKRESVNIRTYKSKFADLKSSGQALSDFLTTVNQIAALSKGASTSQSVI